MTDFQTKHADLDETKTPAPLPLGYVKTTLFRFAKNEGDHIFAFRTSNKSLQLD